METNSIVTILSEYKKFVKTVEAKYNRKINMLNSALADLKVQVGDIVSNLTKGHVVYDIIQTGGTVVPAEKYNGLVYKNDVICVEYLQMGKKRQIVIPREKIDENFDIVNFVAGELSFAKKDADYTFSKINKPDTLKAEIKLLKKDLPTPQNKALLQDKKEERKDVALNRGALIEEYQIKNTALEKKQNNYNYIFELDPMDIADINMAVKDLVKIIITIPDEIERLEYNKKMACQFKNFMELNKNADGAKVQINNFVSQLKGAGLSISGLKSALYNGSKAPMGLNDYKKELIDLLNYIDFQFGKENIIEGK